MDNPKVLISVLNWNNFNSTESTIKSIKNTSYNNFELIIVDNNSKDDSIQKINKNFPDLKIIANKKNLGYAGGHKVAISYLFEGKFDLLWILNNDLLVDKNSLTELVNSYKQNGDALYGSLILDNKRVVHFSGGNELANGFIDYYNSNLFFGEKYDDIKNKLIEKKTGILHGASFMIPASIIKSFGFMKTSFFLYGEEVDYCLRLLQKGIYSYFVPSSIVFHFESETINMNEKLSLVGAYYQKRNSLYYNFNFNFPQSGKLHLIRKNGGLSKNFGIIIKYYLRKFNINKRSLCNEKDFYESLALFHFLLGVKGKIINPDEFVNF